MVIVRKVPMSFNVTVHEGHLLGFPKSAYTEDLWGTGHDLLCLIYRTPHFITLWQIVSVLLGCLRLLGMTIVVFTKCQVWIPKQHQFMLPGIPCPSFAQMKKRGSARSKIVPPLLELIYPVHLHLEKWKRQSIRNCWLICWELVSL